MMDVPLSQEPCLPPQREPLLFVGLSHQMVAHDFWILFWSHPCCGHHEVFAYITVVKLHMWFPLKEITCWIKKYRTLSLLSSSHSTHTWMTLVRTNLLVVVIDVYIVGCCINFYNAFFPVFRHCRANGLPQMRQCLHSCLEW